MPDLPAELIDALATINPQYASKILLAFALVSRRWRHCTNARRFSEIVVYINGTISTTSLQMLTGLLTSIVWQYHEGIAQHVRKLSLRPGRRNWNDEQRDGAGACRSTSIATILRVISRADRSPAHGPAKNSLPLGVGFYGGLGFSFDRLADDVIAALHDLCHSPSLTTLSLECVRNVPPSFVCSSALTELSLVNVTFRPWDASSYINDTAQNFPLPNLKVLELDRTPSFLHVGLNRHNPPPSLEVLNLSYWVESGQSEGYDALYCFGRELTDLSINFHNGFVGPSRPIDYTQVGVLTSLRLTLETYISHWLPEDAVSIPPTFLNTVPLLPPVLPPKIYIHFVTTINLEHVVGPHCGLDDVFPRLDHPALADFLERSIPQAPGARVTIALSIHVRCLDRIYGSPGLEEGCVAYARERFARLDRMEGVELQISVTIPSTGAEN